MKLDFTLLCTSYALVGKHFQSSWLKFLGDSQILLTVNLIKPDYLLSILNQINNNIEFTMEKKSKKTIFFEYDYKQKWYKNLNGYLRQTNGLKTICPI